MFGENDIEKLFLKEEYGKVVKSDYAIVLGCDTQGAVARADMAANFYFKGGAEKLIVSGGVERDYKGGKAPECAIKRDNRGKARYRHDREYGGRTDGNMSKQQRAQDPKGYDYHRAVPRAEVGFNGKDLSTAVYAGFRLHREHGKVFSRGKGKIHSRDRAS